MMGPLFAMNQAVEPLREMHGLSSFLQSQIKSWVARVASYESEVDNEMRFALNVRHGYAS